MTAYGPPIVGLRLTLYATAPVSAVHPRLTIALPGTAVRLPGLPGRLQARTALSTLRRPLVTTSPVRDGITSTLLRIDAFSGAGLTPKVESSNAAVPGPCRGTIAVPAIAR